MAKAVRPCYYIDKNGIDKFDVEFEYLGGFAKANKQKNIAKMHESIKNLVGHDAKILEISKASAQPLGVMLSAFNLELTLNNIKSSVERFFQGSKKFKNGGPFSEIYTNSKIHPKKYPLLKESGDFVGFELFNESFSTNPASYFYDFLYLTALSQNPKLANGICEFEYFTDIEFNPKKSLSSQSKSAALFLYLKHKNLLKEALKSKESFLECVLNLNKKDSLF